MNRLIFFLLLFSIKISAQDTIYLDKNQEKILEPNSAEFYKVIKTSENNTELVFEEIYTIEHVLKTKEIFKNYDSNNPLIIQKYYYYDNGKVRSRSVYKNNGEYYEFTTFWKNGNIRRRQISINSELKSGTCWDENGNMIPFFPYEIAPEFPGGNHVMGMYLRSRLSDLKIPEKAKGKILKVKFHIDKTGAVKNVRIEQSVHTEIDQKVLEIIKAMPAWNPGLVEGEPEIATKTLPIRF